MKTPLMLLALASLSACSTLPPPANATSQPAKPATAAPLDERISQLSAFLKDEIAPEDYFDDSFLAAVPAAQMKAISQSIIGQYGQPLKILSVDRKSANAATVKLAFEKAVGTININIAAAAPHKVTGWVATGFASQDDSLSKIAADFAALHGSSGFIVEKLNDNGPNERIAASNADTQFAIGSTFKLYILAELAAQIQAGERKWEDVVPLSQRSFSSQATGRWPKDSPVTLQTLALQMISVSDNSASDTLLHVLGRTAVERKLAQIGHSAPNKILPFLSTLEAFALKSPANADLRNRFLAASEAKQRDIIEREQAKLGFDQVDDQAFAYGPAFNDTLEWFASPDDLAYLLNHLRRSGGQRILEIMAVNPGIGADAAKKWGYLGYKGGSEPGVMSMSFLLHSRSGQWYAVSGSWNDPAKEVDQTGFALLMTRLVALAE